MTKPPAPRYPGQDVRRGTKRNRRKTDPNRR